MQSQPRSYLYVPADRPTMVTRAVDRGADAIILDLEDGIARSRHGRARAIVLDQAPDLHDRGHDVWVRLGPEDLQDPSPLVTAGLRKFVIPKVSTRAMDRLVERGADDVEIIGLVETARTVVDLTAVAHHPALVRLGLGIADLTAELDLAEDRAPALLAPVRLGIVLASAAAGLPAPIAPTSQQLDDPGTVEATTRGLRAEGFGAHTCIHPLQVAAVHAGLAPDPDELREARAVLSALGTATPGQAGAVRTADGRMVDEAVARAARNVLARAGDQATDPSRRNAATSSDG